MFKALNDLLAPDFSELFQLNESLHGLRSNGPQKLCIPNINSVRFGKVLFEVLTKTKNNLKQPEMTYNKQETT